MCGINGFTFKDETFINRMNNATKHRGPDGVGVFMDDHISLGHNLLAIVDKPENSSQPVVSDDYVLVYNGEGYNYQSLRETSTRTNSDTEVIFAGLARHGIDFIARLDGMFAIAWYDRKKKKIFLARDSVGMKPIYYTMHRGHLLFSSEMRGLFVHDIPRNLNHNMAGIFFALGYVPGRETLIKDLYKVMPGEVVEFDIEKKEIKTRWLSLDDRKNTEGNINEFIGTAVNQHTMGLRPFGLYLSGGLDSTIILHELAKQRPEKIKTYTTRFDAKDEKYNQDADMAKKLCQEYTIEHHEIFVREQDFIDAIEPSIVAMEEPRYNHSVPAYWLLAREAAKEVVVILNGSGGDELFLGYSRYEVARKVSERMRWPWWKIGYALKGVHDTLSQWAYVHAIQKNTSTISNYLRTFHYPRVEEPLADSVNAIAEYDRLFWLADEEFLRTDKISMHFGMEGRFPLMARSIRQIANSISSKEKETSKKILREIYKNKLPDYIINKPKTGWNAPVTEWMHGKFGEIVQDTLGKDFVKKEMYTLRDMKSMLPLFSFKLWMRYFHIQS